jgi:hypothetical protein
MANAILQKQRGDPPQFALLAILTYIAVRPVLQDVNRIVLDRDYSGVKAERIIVRRLTELARRDWPRFKSTTIKLDNIAGSPADRLAREVFRGIYQPDGEITLAEILAAL